MRYFDFTSWQGILTTILGLAVFTLIGVGVRVLMMQTIQQRRERMNRQINERLRTLIAAYKTLGGSFTGRLTVNPAHLRDLAPEHEEEGEGSDQNENGSSDRSRRIRDAVEAALADIILLGTEEHVRMASQAAEDMAAGRPIHTAALVASLRDFIRTALDLGPIPDDVTIPLQGPTRVQGSGNRGKNEGGNRNTGRGGAGGGGGAGMGMGIGLGVGRKENDNG
ncbi:hypothetical protein GCM10007205_26920 [Oxalicibacterium flavum]|uniref:Uncharacterized protein n=1 Tax=Oxalicibacterium flavum TaxID=179467 RepID=A0A8J2UQ04_9BURK|nr:hypothetical protein [Oxalicibacterium flavum]GGC16532.1 hypothetical protein GCM10007205_26920 [Oxalicibacterium flavum]